ncbi:MAG: amino acid carrier protein [Synergistaceae bacterium]|nr:amino acid carrier protein [Synergistaceae bacterium]
METIIRINRVISNFVWGIPGLTLLVGTGVYLTLLLRLPQLRYFLSAMAEVFSFRKEGENDKSVSSFAAMATAIAATVGTGNVAGVATALHLAGPGALVWMLISALFGMCTKFAEVTLAVHYRQKDAHGDWRGGTMYILENGLCERGGIWKPIGKLLAFLFSLFTILAVLGSGAATEANSVAEALFLGWNVDHLYSGLVMAVLVGLVIIGGLSSLSRVTVLIVPFMAVFYIVSAIIILVSHASHIPAIIAESFRMAFSNPDPSVITAGLAGWGVKEAVHRGIARGVFSNEAGMGSAPMAHVTADVAHPVQQGFYGIFEVFLDTIVICTMTALILLVTGTLTDTPELTGSQLALRAFEFALGPVGKYIFSIGFLLFTFTTTLGWYWYAETAITYMFGVRVKSVMKLLMITMILFGAAGAQFFGLVGNEFLTNLWDISDTLNGLMALPNLIALLLLSFTLRRIVKDYDAKKKRAKGITVARAMAGKRLMPKEMQKLLIVSACATLLPIGMVYFGSDSRDKVHERDVSLRRVLEAGHIALGVDIAFPPMSFVNDKGEIVGFDIDLLREVSKRLGIELVIRPIDWDNKENELRDGTIDCIGSMSVIPEAVEAMRLSEAYVKEDIIFVIRDDSRVKWLNGLKGKTIGVRAGLTTQEALKATDIINDVTVVPLDDNMLVLQQLKEGKLDAALVDSLVACYFIFSTSERYFVLSDNLGEEELAIGFRKNDRKLGDRVQEVISGMKADGTLGKISQKWFGSDITVVK